MEDRTLSRKWATSLSTSREQVSSAPGASSVMMRPASKPALPGSTFRDIILKIKMGYFLAANQVVKERCAFPGVCGFVCPVENCASRAAASTEPLGAVSPNPSPSTVLWLFMKSSRARSRTAPARIDGRKVGLWEQALAGLLQQPPSWPRRAPPRWTGSSERRRAGGHEWLSSIPPPIRLPRRKY